MTLNLTHFTTPEIAKVICASGKLGTGDHIFAIPGHYGKIKPIWLRNLIISCDTTEAPIEIPKAALSHFKKCPVFGPMTLLHRLKGTQLSPTGHIDLATGDFVPSYRKTPLIRILACIGDAMIIPIGIGIGYLATLS